MVESTNPNVTQESNLQDRASNLAAQFQSVSGSSRSFGSGTLLAGQTSRVSAVANRYRDAYLIAKTVTGFGSFLKIGGVVLTIALLLISALVILSAVPPSVGIPLLVVIAIFSVVIAVLFYVAGVIVSANGQALKASIDCAVNGSPFIDDDQKAAIMSLPT